MESNKDNSACDHMRGIVGNVSPNTKGCQECEKNGTGWVALRLCLTCGHVGCCDSSVGMHATRHFKETGHAAMAALPNKSWRWCYIHKYYM